MKIASICRLFAFAGIAMAQATRQDPALPAGSARSLVSEVTLEEKISQILHSAAAQQKKCEIPKKSLDKFK